MGTIQAAISKAYKQCAEVLDTQSVGYSVVEIATFPLMCTEIAIYNSNGTVGSDASSYKQGAAYCVIIKRRAVT